MIDSNIDAVAQPFIKGAMVRATPLCVYLVQLIMCVRGQNCFFMFLVVPLAP